MSYKNSVRGRGLRRTALVLALGACFATGVAFAQSNTTGTIFGQAEPGTTIVLQNVNTGATRSVQVDSSGRYRTPPLQVGTYRVVMQRDGADVASRDNVPVTISGGSEVSFGGNTDAQVLEGISVVASALPAIDVSSVDSRTVLTSEQLAKIPVARNSVSAALLAPGVVRGDSRFGNNVLAMGGSGISENSYSINGYNITNPQTNETFFEMPFGAIDQQQVLTGGLGAEFGHSTGGAINIVGKHGTNKWEGGFRVDWAPSAGRAGTRNLYYPENPDAGSLADGPGPYGHGGAGITEPFKSNGKLRGYRNDNNSTQTVYSAWLGGPLIDDRLFFYAAADFSKTDSHSVGAAATYSEVTGDFNSPKSPTGWNEAESKGNKWYAKLDWNITDNHILEFTGVGDKSTRDDKYYEFDYTTLKHGAYSEGTDGRTKSTNKLYMGKYTGYLTDNLTLTALYGHSETQEPNLSDLVLLPQIRIASGGSAPPQSTIDAVGNHRYDQPETYHDYDSWDKTDGWRVDLEYRIGDHSLRGGVDRQTLKSSTGTELAGETALGEGPVVGDNTTNQWGGQWAYIVDLTGGDYPAGNIQRILLRQGGDYKMDLNAYYLEDNWQITDRWLAYIGLRNESFANYNSFGKKFMEQKNQWAPRLGLAWDVNGDSSLKIYANAGRYFLALPNGVAVRGAGGSLYTTQIFGFDHVDPSTGLPVGLDPLTGAESANAEFGQPRDPKTARIADLKSHYQDEFILGFDKSLGSDWTVGARATYRILKAQVDDTGDGKPVCRFMEANGLFIDQYTDLQDCYDNIPFPGVIFNPGRGADFYTAPYYDEDDNVDVNRLIHVKLTADELGMPKPKRKYAAFNAYLEHPFNGTWYGRLDYTWSHSYGNTEGQIKSDIAQGDVAASQDWDFADFMFYANGNLPNDRRHQVRAFGYWQLTPEWMLSSTILANSGRPKNCIGPWVKDPETGLYTDPDGYMSRNGASGAFHMCYGEPSPRGSLGTLPWTYTMDLGVQWRPAFAGNNLSFNLNVFNVFNQQRTITVNETSVGGAVTGTSGGSPNNMYQGVLATSPPRYTRLSMQYDFSL